ncbi:hypothetical protein FZZ85_03815 [Synechococcus sp. MU1642]|nr:hypothetical protein [Synechococcus sp. MU1642]
MNVDIPNDINSHFLYSKNDACRSLDGSGQNLERRYRLEIWRETVYWMQSRCCDLRDLDRERDAASIYTEFRLRGVA